MTINTKKFEVLEEGKLVEGKFILTQDGILQKESKIKDSENDIYHTIVEDVNDYGYEINWLN